MIVQCTSCQTRFRVPDEKIGEKAVKVRCSKCQNVFAVKRGADGNAEAVGAAPPPVAAAPAPPPPAAAPPPPPLADAPEEVTRRAGPFEHAEATARADPFAAFGPPPVPQGEVTRTGVWHAGIAATRPQKATGEVEVTRPGVALNALIATKIAGAENVAAPPPPPPEALAGPEPLADLPPPPPGLIPAPDPFGSAGAELGAPDPFSGLELDLSNRGPASAPPPLPAGAQPDPFGSLDLPEAPPASPEPALAAADPFDRPAPAPAADVDPFANLSLSRPSMPAAPPAPAPAPAPASAGLLDPFANLDLAAAPAAAPAPAMASQDAVSFSFESGAAPAPQPTADDYFSAPPAAPAPRAAPASSASFGEDELTSPSGEPDRSMFDLPPPPPASQVTQLPSEPLAPAGFEAPRPAPAARARPPTTSSRPAAPKKPAGQRVLGAVLNGLFVLAVGWGSLLTYASWRADWHFEPALLRPAELGRAIFGGRGAAAALVLEDVTSGIYETKGGKQVLFVRGQVVNRGKGPLGPARAHVELVDGDQVMAQADGWAGKPVTPEQVYNLGDPTQLAALVQQQRAAAQSIAPGEARPFVAVMLEFPSELGSHAIRVTPDLGKP